MKIPITEIAVKLNKKIQLMVKFSTSPKKPIKEFIAMINNEVPTAFFIGNFANNTNDGIIRNPPPAPTSPIIIPIKKV